MRERKAKWTYIMFWALVFGFVPLFVFLHATVIRPLVEQSRGNYRIDYYGRVIDKEGRGVPGVEIEFRIIYSGAVVKPGMFGRSENFRFVKVITDSSGDFSIRREYGYTVEIHSVLHKGVRVGLPAVGLKPEDDPGYGVRMGNASMVKKLPNTPDKRVLCEIVPLGQGKSTAQPGRP